MPEFVAYRRQNASWTSSGAGPDDGAARSKCAGLDTGRVEAIAGAEDGRQGGRDVGRPGDGMSWAGRDPRSARIATVERGPESLQRTAMDVREAL